MSAEPQFIKSQPPPNRFSIKNKVSELKFLRANCLSAKLLFDGKFPLDAFYLSELLTYLNLIYALYQGFYNFASSTMISEFIYNSLYNCHKSRSMNFPHVHFILLME